MVESLDELLETLQSDDQENSNQARPFNRSELSLDVGDLLSLDLDSSPIRTNASGKSTTPEKIKCCPTFISGSQGGLNSNSSSAFRGCTALHCRDCDFPVRSFPNHEWTEAVEYLFLRTNMPDSEKVLEKLIRKTGSVAYACHCVSFSAGKLLPLHETNLPWFCRGKRVTGPIPTAIQPDNRNPDPPHPPVANTSDVLAENVKMPFDK